MVPLTDIGNNGTDVRNSYTFGVRIKGQFCSVKKWNEMNDRILIAFYSRKGLNYRGGNIVNLEVGNTEVVARQIQETTGGDLFEIETIKQYPLDYYEATEVSKQELYDAIRPELATSVKDMSSYDVLYLGYPNWWGTMPMAVWTFLESYDFTGKTIIPFCTHEGSGLGNSERDIKRLCPSALVKKGLAIRGSSVKNALETVKKWI
jgi:flavodoxin